VRLRQVAVVAQALAPVAERVQAVLGLDNPYRDPSVAEFGLENAVFAVGDCFVEVVAPVRPNTTAGRYLERRGADAGYMAIFQVPDLDVARARVAALGIRVVWRADHDDIAGTHLHPADVGGAIVSLDWAAPSESWPWAGPQWTGRAPAPLPAGGLRGITVAAVDPVADSGRWASVLGVPVVGGTIALDEGRQTIRFVAVSEKGSEGIVAIALDGEGDDVDIGGVRLVRVRSGHG
jgi:hypothetical protein